ncbi:Transmembrane 9 super member 2 [Microbotryomycetes sp. JL201]|nr:Transmembrane 9 super member 2 [Microbotryomycetes sp. JL201]
MTRVSWPVAAIAAAAVAFVPTHGFYLPGAAPNDYNPGDQVPLLVNRLTPAANDNQAGLTGLVSYNYYDSGFAFCKPNHAPKQQSASLGSALMGDRLYDSAFDIHMLENATCRHLCTASVAPESASFLTARITDHYHQNWLIDGLPVAEMKQDDATKELFYSAGFALGSVASPGEGGKPRAQINNHFDIFIEYHTAHNGFKRVVGAVVWPKSLNSMSTGDAQPQCTGSQPFIIQEARQNEIPYTYSITWRESPTTFATRWDHYLRVFDPKIHFLSLMNSIVVALFLCLLVGMILLRTLHKDIVRYNSTDLDEDVQEDFGWKLLHGEVFRPPRKRMFLSVAVGSGAQMGAMSVVTLLFALLGFLSPSNRGALSTLMLVTYTLFGFISGYVSSRLFASLKGEEWRKNIILTTVLFPGCLVAFLLLLNFFLLGSGSSGAVPFGTFCAIVAMWLLIDVPLTIVGAWLGVQKGPIDAPVRVNQIPRQIPPTEWWLKPWPATLIAGVLPFGAAFIEISYLMQSLFGAKVYYAFGFLALTSAVVALTTATTTVLLCYFHLCAEDYRWHWRAFLTGGGSAFWVLAYGLLYWATKLSLPGFANKILFLSYLILISAFDFFVMGAVGYVSCWIFLRVIYSRIRVD